MFSLEGFREQDTFGIIYYVLVQWWNRLLLLEIVQFLTWKDVHRPWTMKCTLSVNEDSIPRTEKFIIHKISIYVLYFWSAPIPRVKLINNIKDLVKMIGAHFCKVLTLFRIPVSFSSTFRRINPKPNTVIRCKNSTQYVIFNYLNRKTNSSLNCSQCTNYYWNDLNWSTVPNSSDLVF